MDIDARTVREQIRYITPERWYRITFDRIAPRHGDPGTFPVLLTEDESGTLTATYADMSQEVFSGITEMACKFYADIVGFVSDDRPST